MVIYTTNQIGLLDLKILVTWDYSSQYMEK